MVRIWIVILFIIAGILRFWNLTNVPPSASLDEVSIGYNAYSILLTGKDEYGYNFPILLRAYDDWRPAIYVYLVIPFIKLLGLNIVAVRLPSVILSTLTVITTYFLVKKLFGAHGLTQIKRINTKLLALFASFLLAISPWHIYISRLGHEVNVGLSFVVFATTLFIYAVKEKSKRWMLILSSVFFALSFYTYQSQKIFVPLVLICLFMVFRKNIFAIKRQLFFSLALGLLLVIPITLATMDPQALIRFKGTSAFNNGNKIYQENALKVLSYKNEGNILGQIIYNRRLVPVKIFISNYFLHFNPKFIFLNNGLEDFKVPDFGQLYVWEFPFLVTGVIYLFIANFEKKIKVVILTWFFSAFVAPSLTTGAPHAMRAYNVLPIPQVFVALGIIWAARYFKKTWKYLESIFYFCLFSIIALYSIYFYRQYFFAFPKLLSSSFQYPLAHAIPFVLANEKSYAKIVFSNKGSLYQSYMFLLFYKKYDPFLYQAQGGTKSGGFAESHKFGKYEFKEISNLTLESNVAYIGNISDFSPDEKPTKAFRNLNNKEEIKIVEK